MTVISSNSW